MIERAIFLSPSNVIRVQDLGIAVTESAAAEFDFDSQCLASIEKHIINRRLSLNDHNAIETAASLGLSRSAYYRRLEKYNLG